MRIVVLYFGPAREAAKMGVERVEVRGGTMVAALVATLRKRHRGIGRMELSLALNARPVSDPAGARLRDGDELALIPPISGGKGSNISVQITKKRISLDDAISFVRTEGAGAVVVFIGSVRSPSRGRRVVALEYDAYGRMAEDALRAIAREACEEFGVVSLCISHRIGRVRSGDVVLATAVSAVHRDEAYRASRFVIEELEERVPIWKRELSNDGGSWVEGRRLREGKG